MGKMIDMRGKPPGYSIKGLGKPTGGLEYRWRCRYSDDSVTTSRPHETYDAALAEAWDDYAMEQAEERYEKARQVRS